MSELTCAKPWLRDACVFLVCLLLAFTMCVWPVPLQMGKDTAPTVERSVGWHLLLEGVRNFGEVTPTLYRGGQPTREGFDRLAKMEINIVVDTGRSKRDEKQIKQLGTRHLKRLLADYISYYHADRTRLGLGKQSPAGRVRSTGQGWIVSLRRVGGLHHRYDRAA